MSVFLVFIHQVDLERIQEGLSLLLKRKKFFISKMVNVQDATRNLTQELRITIMLNLGLLVEERKLSTVERYVQVVTKSYRIKKG